MKALIFNGALERHENSTSQRLSNFLAERLEELSITPNIYNIADSGIPLFDTAIKGVPKSVELMNTLFRDADIHIWLTPLYHGSLTGVMKNCLDWLECSAKLPNPYLTGKLVGLACWADGVQAIQGINTMDTIAKSLRAWTLPYSVPIHRANLFDENGEINGDYQQRFQLLLQLLVNGPQQVNAVTP